MNILSLYDGMSCGMIAMLQAGVKVDRYVAYEIDKYAVKTSKHNFPTIEHMGDVFNGDFTQYEGFDFLVGGSPCEPAGTKIKVFPNGYKNIEDIQVGDMVLTHKNRYKRVVRTMSRKTDHLYHIKFNGSETLKLTGNHPIYVYRDEKFQWVATEDIKVGDYVCCNINQNQNDTEYTNDMLWLLGRFVAGGYVDKHPRVCFSVGRKKMAEFEKHLGDIHYYINHAQKSAVDYMIEDNRIVDMCKKIEHGAINKFVPDEILNLSSDKLKIFFDGYFFGDGHKRQNRKDVYMWSTISEQLYLSMALLSAKCFGKYPTVARKTENKIRNGFNGRSYNSHDSFNSQISIGGRKSTQRIIGDKLLIPVKKITKVKTDCMVYNMQVQDDESYTSNNIITHNCTYWSIAQKNNRETEASGLGWELFSQYVRALNEAKPKFFIYENNKSMSKAIRESIRETFGFEEICINSALVSAQNRQRYYWVGKRNDDGTYSKVDVDQPEDRGILLRDVLDGVMTWKDKQNTIDANYFKGGNFSDLKRQSGQRFCVAEPLPASSVLNINPSGSGINGSVSRIDTKSRCLTTNKGEGQKIIVPVVIPTTKDGKANALTSSYHKAANSPCSGFGEEVRRPRVAEPVCVAERGRYNENGDIEQHIEARPDGKTSTVTTVGKDNMVAEPVGTTKEEKSYCLMAGYANGSVENIGNYVAHTLTKGCKSMVAEPCCMRYERSDEAKRLRKQYESGEIHHGFHELSELHPREDGKTNTVSTVLKDNPICEPVCVQEQVLGRKANLDGTYTRVYEARKDSKSGTLTGTMRQNAVALPVNETANGKSQCLRSTCYKDGIRNIVGNNVDRKTGVAEYVFSFATPVEWNENGVHTKATSGADGKVYTVYQVLDGNITIKGKTYPIKLLDGYYIIRKLTVSECKRLQTVPEWFDFSCVSNSQSYKMLGNGWTVEVIMHLINACLNSIK